MPIEDAQSGFNAIFLLFPLVLAAVLGFAIWSYQQGRKRTEAMQATAAANGWQWLGEANSYVDAWSCPPFGTGQVRRVSDAVRGTYRGAPFLAFGYRYYTESTQTDANGQSQTTRHNHSFDVAVLEVRANLPDLHLSPEGTMARIVDAVTGGDIDLESDAFNRMFRLRCVDKKFAFDTFHARTMEYLLARGRVRFDISNGDVVMSRQSSGHDPTIWGPGDDTVPVAQGDAPLDVMLTVLLGIPDFVWQDRGGRPVTVPRVA
ncbi:MAG: hypothetical protein ABIZ07_10270 [Dermatophilaceae bacterium]